MPRCMRQSEDNFQESVLTVRLVQAGSLGWCTQTSCSFQAVSARHLTTGVLGLQMCVTQLAFSCEFWEGNSCAFAEGAIYPLNCDLSLVAWF